MNLLRRNNFFFLSFSLNLILNSICTLDNVRWGADEQFFVCFFFSSRLNFTYGGAKNKKCNNNSMNKNRMNRNKNSHRLFELRDEISFYFINFFFISFFIIINLRRYFSIDSIISSHPYFLVFFSFVLGVCPYVCYECGI